MPYIAAKNDYTSYENTLFDILKNPVEEFNFLQCQTITGIFGVSTEYGSQYCESIQKEFPEEATKIREGVYDTLLNEFQSIGKPDYFYSSILSRSIDGNTARYFYHALVIKTYMEKKFPGKSLQVVEIGGGYGGLCYWLSKLSPTSIKSYEICDLNAALQLQKSCLDKWNIQCSYLKNAFSWKKTDTVFVISNYGFSEFNEVFQTLYTQTITSKCDGGFMVWNNPTGLVKFTENPIIIEDERPSFKGHSNLFLYF